MDEIRNRWTGEGVTAPFMPIKHTRKSSPRATSEVRAKVVHTSANKRRLEVFITQPVLKELGWAIGGKVTAGASRDGLIKLSPAHSGLKLSKAYKKSSTVRITISGDLLAPGICARVRIVPHLAKESNLIVEIPVEWIDGKFATREPKSMREAA